MCIELKNMWCLKVYEDKSVLSLKSFERYAILQHS